ncbi:MAG: lysophospholipid acyltransferase family protein [candidate division Zixibacteria bacterium]|nr:lysophospholipid acyltransferase family protein [candidate division Zixibacteria bacterium]
MKISHGIEYLAARAAALVFQLLPHRTAVRLGGKAGRAGGLIMSKRRAIVRTNLEIAFGDQYDAAGREELTGRIFDNIGRTIAEVARFSRLSKQQILKLVTSEGTECFQEAVDHGRGAILAGSHFDNWELMGAYVNALGYPVDFMVRSQHNPYFDSYLTLLRASHGVKVIHSDRGMKDVIRALKANRQIAMIADQHGGSGGIIVTFFGRKVSVARAPAALAVKFQAPILTGYWVRNPDDTHHCRFNPLLYPDPHADPDAEIVRLTTVYTQRIERAIRMRPDLWFWTHRRFKPVADGEQKDNPYVESR